MTDRLVPCGPGHADGRMAKAEEFFGEAEDSLALADRPEDRINAVVSALVRAGIAASDVVCCARLGRHSAAPDHAAAVRLLGDVDAGLGNHLARLVRLKSKADYSAQPVSRADLASAQRAAGALLEAARLAHGGSA